MNFQTPFLKHLAFPYFGQIQLIIHMDLIENSYAYSNSVEVVWYEASCSCAALIEIYDLLKVLQFFLDQLIYCQGLGIGSK